MKYIKVAICDDDREMIAMMSHSAKCAGIENDFVLEVAEFDNPKELLARIDTEEFDILFLDVEMPEINGLELAGLIQEKKENIVIIFVTHHDEIVYEVFLYKPFDFVRKSDLENKMRQVFVRLKDIFIEENIDIEYMDDGIKKNLNSDKAVYAMSCGNYVDLWDIKGNRHFVRITLKELMQMLKHCGFIQVHRQYLINKKYWDGYSNNKVIMRSKIYIGIGKSFKKRVKEEYAKKIRR